MKISGSIFAVKDNYLAYARNLQNSKVDYLHIDLFGNELDHGFKLSNLQVFDKSYLPLDIHLIYKTITDNDIDLINMTNAYFLNVEYETLEDKDEIFRIAQKFHGSFGIALTEQTNINILDKYIDYISQVLFMCSEPGVSGARFSDTNYERIQKVKEMYPNLQLYADGGINAKVAEKMNQIGVQMVVSGSYLAKEVGLISEKVYALKYSKEENMKVTRNMIPYISLPIVSGMTTFMEIIDVMNRYRLGVVFVVEKERLLGIITDGDVRRGFLKYKKDIFDISAKEIMNNNPFYVDAEENVENLLIQVSQMHKGINIVPVIKAEKLVGAFDLLLGY